MCNDVGLVCLPQDKAQLLHFYPYLEQPFNYNCSDDEWDKTFPGFSPGDLVTRHKRTDAALTLPAAAAPRPTREVMHVRRHDAESSRIASS